MVNRGGFSFVAMLVINPIVILFYQNCSMMPISHAKIAPPKPAIREIASVKPQSNGIVAATKTPCPNSKQDCKTEKE